MRDPHELNWIHDPEFRGSVISYCSKCASREVTWRKFIGYHDEAQIIDQRCADHAPSNRKNHPVEWRKHAKSA